MYLIYVLSEVTEITLIGANFHLFATIGNR
jgi:hypothetical protein